MKGVFMLRGPRTLAVSAIAVAVTAGAAAGGVALATPGSNGVSGKSKLLAPSVFKSFAVLRRSVYDREHHGRIAAVGAVPAAIRHYHGDARLPGYEVGALDGAAAVQVKGSRPAWLVPGATSVCVVNRDSSEPEDGFSGNCGSLSGAEALGVADSTETASGEALIIGLVPDGNQTVEITEADGHKYTVPVKENVYEVVGGKPTGVTMKNAGGQTVTRHVVTPATAAPPEPLPPSYREKEPLPPRN